jgi:hypothetical protein
MELQAKIDPGICGYEVVVTAATDDARHVDFTFESECELVRELAARVAEISPVDAIKSLSRDQNPILAEAGDLLRSAGCCEACVVPAGAVKAMYIVTNLALPKDVSMSLKRG